MGAVAMVEPENDKDTDMLEEDIETSVHACEIILSGTSESNKDVSEQDSAACLPESKIEINEGVEALGLMVKIINDIVETVTKEGDESANNNFRCDSPPDILEIGEDICVYEETEKSYDENDEDIEEPFNDVKEPEGTELICENKPSSLE